MRGDLRSKLTIAVAEGFLRRPLEPDGLGRLLALLAPRGKRVPGPTENKTLAVEASASITSPPQPQQIQPTKSNTNWCWVLGAGCWVLVRHSFAEVPSGLRSIVGGKCETPVLFEEFCKLHERTSLNRRPAVRP